VTAVADRISSWELYSSDEVDRVRKIPVTRHT
jgi:hypothetical protein